ncbi:uncharacterized protein C01G6.5-like [Dreissena polymorpha]|uniref:FHA domain-containing protein n=1 Tax=Dreissena polymorpha TaxID=45954 RepID=A0A9D4GRH3_DREPO|nr:uncharacterized protein C01G6.5-like [Dreissena polymorpha]KAH3821755.1 hypothetical protein DPMN_123522 [Dreissena polymorpha]
MSEDYVYQLARIGPAATCPKVPDVMRLQLGLTKIGRGQMNDFYLDSMVLKNFISRSHVEILGKKNENGEIEFILTDKGLNGTFINDIRTHKTCVLEVGDKITFGHTNGYKIQPGSYAEQPLSEFQFEFQRVPKSSKTSEMFSERSMSSPAPCEDSLDSIPDLKKDSTVVSDRLFLSDIPANNQSRDKSSKSNSSYSNHVRSRKDSSSQSDSDINSSKNSSLSKTSHQKSGKRNSDSSSKSPPREATKSGSPAKKGRKSSSGSNKFSETLPMEDDEESDEDEKEEPNEDDDDHEDEDVDDDDEEFKPKQTKKPVGRKGRPSLDRKPPVKSKKVVESDSDSSEEDEESKPEADQKPRPPPASSRQKMAGKKKRNANDAPVIGGRKRRRRGGLGGGTSSTFPNDPKADLEPGVEWYEDDKCDAPDCKRPKKKRTQWVQCDDCDGWYHTMCVGANYNKLKDSDEHFNCGCE